MPEFLQPAAPVRQELPGAVGQFFERGHPSWGSIDKFPAALDFDETGRYQGSTIFGGECSRRPMNGCQGPRKNRLDKFVGPKKAQRPWVQ